MANSLATATATSRLTNVPGRAIVTARGHHFIVDSPPPLGGPNEEINPIDVLLGALATCGTFVCETAAQEQQIPLQGVSVDVAGDFDPRGVCGEPVDPSIQALRVRLNLTGPSPEQAQLLAEAFRRRCPVYGTLAKAAPIEMDVVIVSQEPDLKQKEIKMKKLRCGDIGFDCDHEITAESEEEILAQAAAHAETVHGLKEITPEVVEAVKGAIQET